VDELLKQIILGAPNLAVGVGALWWASRLIERMIASQEKLVDQLMSMCAENTELKVEAVANGKTPAKPL